MFIVGKSFFSETLSKLDIKTIFDANIDTLQAPSDKKYQKKNEKRSQKYTTLPQSIRIPVKRQDTKSNLDFLGIFDTRKYFFIPQNRRSQTKDNMLSSLFGFLNL